MRSFSGAAFEMTRRVVTKSEANQIFKDDKYKLELIRDLPESEDITIYTQGDFIDLCRGGHIGNTKAIQHVKLLSIAGAYWRGDVKNEQLQRLYGTSWFFQRRLASAFEIIRRA
jgi:threonyl-tRNA synthetase